MSEGEITMAFDANTQVTISRGKLRGQRVTIVSGPDGADQYAVKTEDGDLAVIGASNLKAPAEATVSESRLAAEIQTLAGDYRDSRSQEALSRLVSALSGDAPGLGARISWPDSEVR